MSDFHVSDYGTQTIPNSKYYWQNEKSKCCVVVPDDVNKNPVKPALVYFVQAAPDVIIQGADGTSGCTAVTATPGVVIVKSEVFERLNGACVRPENCPKILDNILTLIDKESWSFPRSKASKPYITDPQATLFESSFMNMVQAVRDAENGNCLVASIAVAGSMLCDRLGIKPDAVFEVSHYDMSTNTQDDDRIAVVQDRDLDMNGRNVIIIDDLISSGRTANAVIEKVLQAGASKIAFLALYRTLCSCEVELNNDPKVMIQWCHPLSNAYWTYGRGFDLTDDESRNSKDIYAATKHWDWETEKDVADLVTFFEGILPEAYDTYQRENS